MGISLATLRKNAGYATQDALARRLGVDDVTISRWENGRREPRLAHISELATALCVSEGEIVDALTNSSQDTA